MEHIVSLSGGSASAVAADRVIERYGSDTVTLWFADTLWEDEDLYRFLKDLEARWEKEIVRHTDGRTPLEVADQAKLIPNSLAAPCSHRLKQEPFLKYIKARDKPLTVHLGLSWDEEHRMGKPKEIYEQVTGVTVDFPLLWKPLPLMSYTKTIVEWGIKAPRLEEYGFPHNNCGGRCVRQGIREWLRLKKTMPERYEEVSQWEQQARAQGGPRSTRSILKDRRGGVATELTLEQLKAREFTDQLEMNLGDNFGCFCEY
jgi:3'-phosphoadenosine 5'-phosphosulfate sulfotransferase (PAPS reductase)/FAD synthetase